MRVLVTGAGGMLGQEVCRALEAAGDQAVAALRSGPGPAADVTRPQEVWRLLEEQRPDRVIHCAAWTDVNGAERDPVGAFRVNAHGSRVVASACADLGIPVCAISSDFVFDGCKGEPYDEFDAPNPISEYGRSKLAGEEFVRHICPRHWIVRTAWLYGAGGRCFPDAVLRRAEEGRELRVVADQRGSPTYARDLAEALVRLVRGRLYGTWHLAGSGEATWHQFARATLELAGHAGVEIAPISSVEWPSPARRPACSVLRSYALELAGEPPLRPWREALADYVRERAARLRGSGSCASGT